MSISANKIYDETVACLIAMLQRRPSVEDFIIFSFIRPRAHLNYHYQQVASPFTCTKKLHVKEPRTNQFCKMIHQLLLVLISSQFLSRPPEHKGVNTSPLLQIPKQSARTVLVQGRPWSDIIWYLAPLPLHVNNWRPRAQRSPG